MRASLISAILASSLTLNVVLLLDRRPQIQAPQAQAAIAPTAEAEKATSITEDAETGVERPSTDEAAGELPDQIASAKPLPRAPTLDAVAVEGWMRVSGNVDHSLARTFQREAGEDGPALSGVFTRLFVWELDVRRDLRKGDAIAVVWRKRPDGLPEVAAASLAASKLGRSVTAYRWQAPGDAYPSYWRLDGTEVPLRLKDGPIEHYEQITSLLKDRPTHKGMDFKTPVGTEVKTPRAGVVTRTNWNWRANGNGIEIRYDDGVLAKFLHLNENRVKKGDRVSAGQIIALSGNTGHSTAPHLHYQLDRGKKTLDPLDYHGSYRRTLDANAIAELRRSVAGLETMLAGARPVL